MKRILTAVVLIAFVVALVLYGKLWMVLILAALVAALAAIEFRALAAAVASPVPLWWTLVAIATFFATNAFQPQDTVIGVSIATVILFAWNAFRTPLENVLSETAAGVLMLVYIAYPLTLLSQILSLENGTAALLFLFVCVWFGDIAALYVGKNFGMRKLSPRLSPNKTWEGAIASVLASIAFGMGLLYLGSYLAGSKYGFTKLHSSEPWWQSVILAAVLNVAAQFGDLLESALKRGAGVKDSGTLLPGHGGILDRIDALLLAAPVFWFVMLLKDRFALGAF